MQKGDLPDKSLFYLPGLLILIVFPSFVCYDICNFSLWVVWIWHFT